MLRQMVLDCDIQHHVESSLHVSRATPIGTRHTLNLITEINTFNLYESRIVAKSDKVVGVRTLSLLGTVHADRDSHVDRSRSLGTAHRAGSINNSHTIKGSTIEVIGQVVPVLIHHETIGIVHSHSGATTVPATTTIAHNLHCLSNTLIRIQRLSVDLLSSVLSKVSIGLNGRILLHTLNVMTSKGVLIDHTGAGRNLVELDLVPTVLRHETLNDVDALTKHRQSLTILLVIHTESGTSLVGQLTRLLGRSILGLQPLSEQRRGLAGHVECQLLLHECKSILLKSSAYEHIEVVPTAELRDVLQVAHSRIAVILNQPLHAGAEETTLTLATTHVTDVEQALQSIHRVFLICLLEHQNDILVGTSTICGTHSKHIEQVALSSLMSHSTVFSVSEIGNILQTGNKLVHSEFSFFSLISSWTRGQ